jgi:recombination protein RecA
MRGGASTIALSAVRAVQQHGKGAWCAWITEASAPPLYAPAVAQAGVDLERLLVVRPSPADLARTVVKVGAAGAFDLVVVDAPAGLDGKLAISSDGSSGSGSSGARSRAKRARVDGSVVIRKLALAAEEKGTTFVVLTNLYTSRAVPWPVALRIEVERRPEAIAIRVTKDRRGRASSQHVVRVAC